MTRLLDQVPYLVVLGEQRRREVELEGDVAFEHAGDFFLEGCRGDCRVEGRRQRCQEERRHPPYGRGQQGVRALSLVDRCDPVFTERPAKLGGALCFYCFATDFHGLNCDSRGYGENPWQAAVAVILFQRRRQYSPRIQSARIIATKCHRIDLIFTAIVRLKRQRNVAVEVTNQIPQVAKSDSQIRVRIE